MVSNFYLRQNMLLGLSPFCYLQVEIMIGGYTFI